MTEGVEKGGGVNSKKKKSDERALLLVLCLFQLGLLTDISMFALNFPHFSSWAIVKTFEKKAFSGGRRGGKKINIRYQGFPFSC